MKEITMFHVALLDYLCPDPSLKRLSDKAVSCEDTLPGYSAVSGELTALLFIHPCVYKSYWKKAQRTSLLVGMSLHVFVCARIYL